MPTKGVSVCLNSAFIFSDGQQRTSKKTSQVTSQLLHKLQRHILLFRMIYDCYNESSIVVVFFFYTAGTFWHAPPQKRPNCGAGQPSR